MDRLYADLCRFDTADWRRAIDTLASEIHDIDRNATKIWFAFYPLQLHLALEQSTDIAATVRTLGLMGRWRLADHIDSSHRFLYAHRYWPQVKAAIAAADSWPAALPAMITQIADARGADDPRGPRPAAGDHGRRVDDAATGGRCRARGRAGRGESHRSRQGPLAAPGPAAAREGRLAGVVRIHARERQALDGRRSTRAIPTRRFRSSTDRRSRAAPRRTSATIGHATSGAFPTKDRSRSNAVRPRAVRAGSACSPAPKSSRRLPPMTRGAG